MTRVIAPIVCTKYLHPLSSGKLGMNAQPTTYPSATVNVMADKDDIRKEATSCPTGHQSDNIVKRLPEENGRNSKNNAPSTGRFPPTPTPMHA